MRESQRNGQKGRTKKQMQNTTTPSLASFDTRARKSGGIKLQSLDTPFCTRLQTVGDRAFCVAAAKT